MVGSAHERSCGHVAWASSMTRPTDRQTILARRARFMAAALASIGCGAAPLPEPAGLTIAEPEPAAEPTSETEKAAPATPPERAAAPDRDGDGVPDDDDRCPDEPGALTGELRGCPGVPAICLSIDP